jgi:hypothetical protein
MTTPEMSEQFAAAFRARLLAHVRRGRRPRRGLLTGLGVTATLVLGGTAAATATGLLPLPGTTQHTTLAEAHSTTNTGPGLLDLGAPPDGTTGVALSFRCHSPGTFVFDDGAGVTCSPSAHDLASETTYVLPLTAISDGEVNVSAESGAGWTLTAQYVSSTTTGWATNAAGQTYGAMNQHGEPDLIAVEATNGRSGYVFRDELNEANGTTAAEGFRSREDALRWQEENAGKVQLVPVFESDGTTRIGDLRVGG